MKSLLLSVALACAFGLLSCTSAAEEEMADGVSALESVMNIYGAEYASRPVSGDGIPEVLAEEMRDVLETLRRNSNEHYDCILEKKDGFDRLEMAGNYRTAATRANDFALKVSLKFSMEKGQVYYWGADYSYSSRLFDWRAGGLSLSPVAGGDGFAYKFETDSYLYFRVGGVGGVLVKVPVIFKGVYNFRISEGSYSFRLLKYCR